MAGALIVLVIFVGLLFAVALIVIGIYNALVRLRNQVDNAWSQIDVQLKRRHDLIPNLVETAKGYMKHERETFEAITQARSQAMGAQGVADTAKAEGRLADALSKFMLVVENYPDLKANQNYMDLQRQLEGTENRISNSRRQFNEATRDYNTYIRRFFPRMLASWFGFEKKAYFEAEEGAEEAPDVGDYFDE